MAGDWIKMRSNIKDDPDVVLMAGNLSLDEYAIVGRLHSIWAWLDQHSTTGTNVRITSAYLDRLTACPGFADAMRSIDWLRGRDGDLEFPNFERHNGESAKRRASDTKRKQENRTNVRAKADICPKESGPEKRREEIEESVSAGAKSPNPKSSRDPKTIVDSYPRREGLAEALVIVAKQLDDGEDFEAMLAGTKACAAVIRTLPSGHMNRYVPGAEAFFRKQKWRDDPESFKRQGDPKNGEGSKSMEETKKLLGSRAAYITD